MAHSWLCQVFLGWSALPVFSLSQTDLEMGKECGLHIVSSFCTFSIPFLPLFPKAWQFVKNFVFSLHTDGRRDGGEQIIIINRIIWKSSYMCTQHYSNWTIAWLFSISELKKKTGEPPPVMINTASVQRWRLLIRPKKLGSPHCSDRFPSWAETFFPAQPALVSQRLD